jgi:phosphopantothenoylcysteine decarboxylase/phosphopantothenate--cysteine ligase
LEHPSKDIIGIKGKELRGKRIVLCITGSVAAVQSPEIARELMRRGAEVYAVMSSNAQKIIHPNLMEWATGNSVVTELTGKIEHVALVGEHPEKADLMLIAPATANTISKIAAGIDDTTVTTVASTAIGSKTPIIIVPAMHQSMYNHPTLKENSQKLEALGIEFIHPRIEEGKAKIADTEEIVEAVVRKLTAKRDFDGKRLLITAGPTIEYIDDVRIITNKSSGRMGIDIAEEALKRGAEVTLVYGLGIANPPSKTKVLNVETTEEMRKKVIEELRSKDYDIIVAAAAVSDWIIKKPYKGKISTSEVPELTLKLKPAPKIIDEIKKIKPEAFLVIFKAEYNVSNKELIDNAYERLKQAQADLVVANDVSRKGVGFRTETNEVFIIDKEKNVVHVPLTSKRVVAKKILDIIKEKLDKNRLISKQ